jgi:hypothetical protein
MRAGKAWLGLTPKPAVRLLPKKRMCFGVGDAGDAGVAGDEGDDGGDVGVAGDARRNKASQYTLYNINMSVSMLFQTIVTTILQI